MRVSVTLTGGVSEPLEFQYHSLHTASGSRWEKEGAAFLSEFSILPFVILDRQG
jgi:hypothetical protein